MTLGEWNPGLKPFKESLVEQSCIITCTSRACRYGLQLMKIRFIMIPLWWNPLTCKPLKLHSMERQAPKPWSLCSANEDIKNNQIISFEQYSVSSFNQVPDYWDIKEQSSWLESNSSVFGELICRHGLQDVFGIGLLHRHFELHSNERLIRNYTSSTYSIAIGRTCQEAAVAPYLWKINVSDDSSVSYLPLEFCDLSNLPHIEKLAHAHWAHATRKASFFHEFAILLRDYEALDRVTLVALFQRDAFNLRPGQTLSEETHERNRIITLEVRDDVSQLMSDSVKTSWWFSPSSKTLNNATCASHCYSHYPDGGESTLTPSSVLNNHGSLYSDGFESPKTANQGRN
jgi:hypothetical protein